MNRIERVRPETRELRGHDGAAVAQSSGLRRFALQPIVDRKRQEFGSEALFRAGWEDIFTGDPHAASRLMVDNWLLFGFEELIAGRTVFLNCTRETLLSGLLWLLPPGRTVLEILESVEPDWDVLLACRHLKAAGYRFALDDYELAEETEAFLDLANYIKIDFRRFGRRERMCMLSGLRMTGATLIAEKIESREEFHQAVEEGFALFQGFWTGQHAVFVEKLEALDPLLCARLVDALEDPEFAVNEVADLIARAKGLERRLLRRASWAGREGATVGSAAEALEVLGREAVQKIVKLAMTADAGEEVREPETTMRFGADPLVCWMDFGAATPWWFDAGDRARRW